MGGDYNPNYKAMFEDAIRALASIDEALGLRRTDCNSTNATITAIKLLRAKRRDDDKRIEKLENELIEYRHLSE